MSTARGAPAKAKAAPASSALAWRRFVFGDHLLEFKPGPGSPDERTYLHEAHFPRTPVDEALSGASLLLLVYSCKWNPACAEFMEGVREFVSAIRASPSASALRVVWVSCDVSQASYKQFIIEERLDYPLCPWGREEPMDYFGVRCARFLGGLSEPRRP